MEQRVHINRKGPNSVEFDAKELLVPLQVGGETSFEIVIKNHGMPAHIHLSTSENLRKNVIFTRESQYIKGEERIPVLVRLPKDSPAHIKGEIFVATGYGAKKGSFSVSIGMTRAKEELEVSVEEEAEEVELTPAPASVERTGQTRMPAVRYLSISVAAILVSLLFTYFYSYNPVRSFISALVASVTLTFVVLYAWNEVAKITS